MTSRPHVLALALCLLAPAAALGEEAPHDASSDDPSASPVSCTSCHISHGASGATLTTKAGNFNLCSSCHNEIGVGARLGFPWVSGDQAAPGASGHSHRWDAAAVSTVHGAGNPTHADMLNRITRSGGNLTCTICHDPHGANQANGGFQHTSIAVGSAIAPNAGGTGTGTITLGQPAPGASARGYLVDVTVQGSGTTARFRLSNDGGRTWFGWNGSSWVPYTSSPENGRTAGASVALNDGTNVAVSFAGAAGALQVGDRWRFYVSYPFLRASNVDSAMCEDCHSARVQSALRVQGADPGYVPDGTKLFSHPVHEALSRPYDRTGAILDANGAVQSIGDAIATNDIRLDSAGKVDCMSCHYPHNADSNSLSEDAR